MYFKLIVDACLFCLKYINYCNKTKEVLNNYIYKCQLTGQTT